MSIPQPFEPLYSHLRGNDPKLYEALKRLERDMRSMYDAIAVLQTPAAEVTTVVLAPDVQYFAAGTAVGDGTYTAAMYWDDIKQKMCIDWAAVAPADIANWTGIQVWIMLPDNGGYTYSQATGTIDNPSFIENDAGERAAYGTIEIEVEAVPAVAATWTFIAASIDAAGTLNKNSAGNPVGVNVSLDTLIMSDYVENLAISIVRSYDESGGQVYGYAGSWTEPALPRYVAVRVVVKVISSGDLTPITGDLPLGDLSFQTDLWPVPESDTPVRVYAQSVFGDETAAALVDCPFIDLTVQRLAGGSGLEFADAVTNLQAVVDTPAYVATEDGQELITDITWTNPSDVRYGGCVIFVIRADAVHYQISGIEKGTALRWRLADFPAANENVTVYALSVDTSNRRNTYVNGVTPDDAVTLPPPAAGAAGAEWAAVVTGFSAAVTYPTAADGTYKALVSFAFTPPADRRWGWVEIKASTDGGTTWETWAVTTDSPVVVERPVGRTAVTFKTGAFSVAVNGAINSYQAGTTPVQDIIIGTAAGMFDLTKLDPTTYDSDIFKFTTGEFTIWAFDGSLIVLGSIDSDKLNATQINVGGAGSKPGKFAVYNGAGVQIGFIGVEDAYVGGWFKTLGVGGANKASAKLVADASGNLSITGGSFVLNVNGITTTLTNATYGGNPLGVLIADNSTASRIESGFVSGAARVYLYNGTSGSIIRLEALGANFGGTMDLADVTGTTGILGYADSYGTGAWRGKITTGGVNCVRELLVASTQVIDGSLNIVNVANATITGYLDAASYVDGAGGFKVGGTVKIGASGELIPRYFSQAGRPTLTDGEHALWWDTSDLNYLARIGANYFKAVMVGA